MTILSPTQSVQTACYLSTAIRKTANKSRVFVLREWAGSRDITDEPRCHIESIYMLPYSRNGVENEPTSSD